MKIIFFLFVIFTCIYSSINSSFIDNKGFMELIDSITPSTQYANNQKKLVFIKLRETKKKKNKNVNHFARVMQEFLLTIGIPCDVYNWNDKNLVAVLRWEDELDPEFILEHFSDRIENLSLKSPYDFKKDL